MMPIKRPPDESHPLLGAVLVFAFLILMPCGFLAVFGWMAWQDIKALTLYKENECKIISRRVMKIRSHDSNTTHYRPLFTYSHTVNGLKFISSGYDILESSYNNAETIRNITNRFQDGQFYPCWYDPDSPTKAVLIREFDSKYYFSIIPICILSGGVYAFFLSFRYWRAYKTYDDYQAIKKSGEFKMTQCPHCNKVAYIESKNKCIWCGKR